MIVPVRNGGADLSDLLRALEAQTFPRARFEVVVGDDGSTDGSTDDLASEDGWIRVVRGPPLNSYAARNRAVRLSRGRVLAFCDADCKPEPAWIEAGVRRLGQSDLAAGCIRFSPPKRRTVWALLDIDSFKDHERQVRQGTAETANLFVHREVFTRVGGFDDSLPEHGDFDFVQRCLADGASLVYAGDAVVWHPTRDRAQSFLRAVWIYNRWYAVRESRSGHLPEGLKLRSWVPIVQTFRGRRRWGRSIGPDRRWLELNDMQPRARETLAALPLMYLLIPYLRGAAQLQGWRDGRRLRRVSQQTERVDVLLACSSGGHVLQLLALRPAWEGFSRRWVTEEASDTRSLLRDEPAYFLHGPTTRSVSRLLRDLPAAWRLLRRVRPRVVVTTGAGFALPFAWLGRLLGARVVYVETVTRMERPSLSCRMVAPIAARVYVQWPELVGEVSGARYVGSVLPPQ